MSVSVGKALRSARESKNIPLSKVSDDLHIRITYLQAIENGRPEILPSPVQGRGFVRMYSDYLKLDTEKILYAWDHPDIPFSLDS
ncbi:MAG TPA: helix-turn-helix transcriptional regulator, partial [Flexilinea sp.]|nr:helix-turn-helix transcriptional regulator [Flexilinea sp.]